MCDYSLQSQRSRHAQADDDLVTKSYGYGVRGFADADDRQTAVCLFPGTEIAFVEPVAYRDRNFWSFLRRGGSFLVRTRYRTAIFRQMGNRREAYERDALEFADGRIVRLTCLVAGQRAKVLQLPALARGLRTTRDSRVIRTTA
jgi:hypothetical protein